MGNFQRLHSAKVGQLAVRQNEIVGILFQRVENLGPGFDPCHLTLKAVVQQQLLD